MDNQSIKLGTSLLSLNLFEVKSYELILRFKSDEYMKNSHEFYIYNTSNNLSDNIDLTLKNYSELGSGLCINLNNNFFFNKVILRIYDEYTIFHNEYKNDANESLSSRKLSPNIFNQIKLNNSGIFEENVPLTSKLSNNSIFNDNNLSFPIRDTLRNKDKTSSTKSQKEIDSTN